MPFKRTQKAATIENKIKSEIESLAPMLKIESSALRLARFDAAEKVVYLEISCDCPDCDVRAETFAEGIEAHLRRRIPGIAGVRTANPSR